MKKYLKPILIGIAIGIVVLGFGVLAVGYNQDSKTIEDNALVTGSIQSILITKDNLLIVLESNNTEIFVTIDANEYINLSNELIGQEITVEGKKKRIENKIFVDAINLYGIE